MKDLDDKISDFLLHLSKLADAVPLLNSLRTQVPKDKLADMFEYICDIHRDSAIALVEIAQLAELPNLSDLETQDIKNDTRILHPSAKPDNTVYPTLAKRRITFIKHNCKEGK